MEKSENKKIRLEYIDWLKVMGLLMVILAHFNAPKAVMQIRSFDVPLLVMLSGYLASKTFKKNDIKKYYFKRFNRLVIPSWIFLIFFLAVQSAVYKLPSFKDILKGFTFQRDADMVGMLWVIWVYFICALLIPFIDKIGFNLKGVSFWIILFSLFEIICSFTNLSEIRFLYITFFTAVPYGVLTYFGFYYDKLSKKTKILIFAVFLSFFIFYGILLFKEKGAFVLTNDFKYPARLYYLSFSIPIIIAVFEIFRKINIKSNVLITFISKSSFWIYLWHIFFLYFVKSLITDDNLWILQYLLTLVLSVSITFIQNIIVKKLTKNQNLKFLKVFLG